MKIQHNIYSLFYAFTPIIIISFFLLDSMLNGNYKGYVFLIGLAFSIITSIIIGNTIGLSNTTVNSSETCIPFTINKMTFFSKIPINTTILIYTATNLLYTALVHDFVLQNAAFFVIITLLILNDSLYVVTNGCYSTIQIGIACLVGFIIAMLWSIVLHKSNNKSLIYNMGVDNNMLCEMPKKKTYKCKNNKKN